MKLSTNCQYSRLFDSQVDDRESSVASLRRSLTAIVVASLVGAVISIAMIATVVYLYLSSQFPDPKSTLHSPATSGIVQVANLPEGFGHIFDRLNVLEREVESLKRNCGHRHDRRHSTSPEGSDDGPCKPESAPTAPKIEQEATRKSVTGILNQLLYMTSRIQSDHGYHFQSEKSSLQSSQSPSQASTISLEQFSTAQPNPPVPSLDELPPSVVVNPTTSLVELRNSLPRRLVRSKQRRKSRPSRGDTVSTSEESLEPDQRDGGESRQNGRHNRDRDQKRRDRKTTLPPESDEKSCRQCIAPTSFGIAAHFEGQRNGNVQIRNADGWIIEPRIWKYAEWMTQSNKDKFRLSVIQTVNIVEGGVYYIYSQIMFYDSNYAVGQSICVNEVPRFTCTKSNISDDAKQSTCYTAGVIRLSGGDRIVIKLSVPNVRIALYADTSFFGLFKLAS